MIVSADSDGKPRVPRQRVDSTTKNARIAMVRQLLACGTAPVEIMAWLTSDTGDKNWKTNRSNARMYLNLALESIDGEAAQPKHRKQARDRALFTLIVQKALALNSASGLMVAVAAADKLAKIDGAYAVDSSAPDLPLINPSTPEEAVEMIAHARATAELAAARGLFPRPAAPVIDATATEVETDDEADEVAIVPADPNAN